SGSNGAAQEPPSGEQQHHNGDATSKPSQAQDSDPKQSAQPQKPPGGFDTTPLPDAPPGYMVRFCFRCAANLPPADFHTASSDPYLTATLKASNVKRHNEDPDLVHRTRTLRRTTEPEWNDEWIVANVPPSGFTLKCRLYDEDSPDKDDRLGNVTIKIPHVFDKWDGIPPPGKEFAAKKRMISKRAFLLKGLASMLQSGTHMTPKLTVSIQVLGRSDPPYAQMYTLGPTSWVKHFSPMIGRLAGTKVNADENDDQAGPSSQVEKSKSQKYDFQANEMQLQGPVPPRLYHRYVQFRPVIGKMFASTGLRGKVLNAALHKQHNRVYNFDQSTEYGSVEPCSEQASLQFLRLAHFDQGGRVFTYVLTLDGLLRFTETGKEFGIDLLSKHTMHSNVETYVACSGEFFIRRLEHPDASDDSQPNGEVHPTDEISGGPPKADPPPNPSCYQLIIDNDSGTYRPDKSILPDLEAFLEKNLPGLGVIAMHWEEKELQKLKDAQRSVKKKEGRMVNAVMNRSLSSISSAESELERREGAWEQGKKSKKSKKEAALAALENPSKIKDARASLSIQPVSNHASESEICIKNDRLYLWFHRDPYALRNDHLVTAGPSHLGLHQRLPAINALDPRRDAHLALGRDRAQELHVQRRRDATRRVQTARLAKGRVELVNHAQRLVHHGGRHAAVQQRLVAAQPVAEREEAGHARDGPGRVAQVPRVVGAEEAQHVPQGARGGERGADELVVPVRGGVEALRDEADGGGDGGEVLDGGGEEVWRRVGGDEVEGRREDTVEGGEAEGAVVGHAEGFGT
ncbi:Uncharacterized protein TCAP_06843, partial [Tolypocladium capitatum]